MMMRSLLVLALFAGAQAGNIKIAPKRTKKAGKFDLRQKIKVEAKEGVNLQATTTLNATSAMLPRIFWPNLDSEARNLAARAYFRNVYHLPTTQAKMGATEAFIKSSASFQKVAGRDAGTVERLTPNELEHWLTSEFLIEDFKDMLNAGYMAANQIPPGLVSRGPAFATEFRKKTQCLHDKVRETTETHQFSFNYGTTCGAENTLGDKEGCNLAAQKPHRVSTNDDDMMVCNDGGTDACCAQHDLIRTGINVNILAIVSSCKANNAFTQCLGKATPSETFFDKRGISESTANAGATCIYSMMPCLVASKNKFYEIDFKTRTAPHVRSMYPVKGDHHVQVVFPFDHSYGEDMMEDSATYRQHWKSDFEYSHWKHIDPPVEMAMPSTQLDQPINRALWDSIE